MMDTPGHITLVRDGLTALHGPAMDAPSLLQQQQLTQETVAALHVDAEQVGPPHIFHIFSSAASRMQGASTNLVAERPCCRSLCRVESNPTLGSRVLWLCSECIAVLNSSGVSKTFVNLHPERPLS